MTEDIYNANELNVIVVDLDVPFSADQYLGMLFMQPEIKLASTYPFKWENTHSETHKNSLIHLLNLSKDSGRAGLTRNVDFVLIPEYGINGLDSIDLIFNSLKESSVKNQILIGGIDGLTKKEFIQLLEQSSFSKSLLEKMLGWVSTQSDSIWVNTSIIIEKNDKAINYYLQPKLLPSPDGEFGTPMLEGNWVILFRTRSEKPIKFFISVCFDWIGVEEGVSKSDEIAKNMPNISTFPCEQWISFVPQYNRVPSKDAFMESARRFLWDEPWKSIHGRKAITIMINSAASNRKQFGNSSVIFSSWISKRSQLPNSNFDSLDTYTMLTRKGLGSCNEARFRKNRPAIHAIELVLPYSSADSTGEDHYPFRKAFVHTIDGNYLNDDPRYPNPPAPVCAYKKTIEDYLDTNKDQYFFIKNINAVSLETEVLLKAKDALHYECQECRSWTREDIKKIFKNLCHWSGHYDDCDTWCENFESVSLNYFISLLATFKFAQLNIKQPKKLHGTLVLGTRKSSLLIIDLGESKTNYRDLYNDIIFDGKIRNDYEEGTDNLIILATDRSPSLAPQFKNKNFLLSEDEKGGITSAGPIFIGANTILNQIDGIMSEYELKWKLKIQLRGQ